jgi:DNA-binding NtrC family response regulator
MGTMQRNGVFRCGNLLSKHPRMHEVFDQIAAFGKVDAPVLIEGESGTGKQEVARAIHQASDQRLSPLVMMNCGATPENLLEIELFGHVRSVFARPEWEFRPGAFEKAHGGTLFLGHVESLPPGVQVRLLRVLAERRLVRVGDVREVEVDVRVIASTSGLKQLVDEGAFRLDLFWRLGMLRLHLPPLRERPEDVGLLATHFAQQYCNRTGLPKEISPAAMEALLRSLWPGNARELENVIERACFLARGGLIRPEDLPQA